MHRPSNPGKKCVGSCTTATRAPKYITVTSSTNSSKIPRNSSLTPNKQHKQRFKTPHSCDIGHRILLRRGRSVRSLHPPALGRSSPLRLSRRAPQIRAPSKPPQSRSSMPSLERDGINPKVMLDIRRRLRRREPLFRCFWHAAAVIIPRNCIGALNGCRRLCAD